MNLTLFNVIAKFAIPFLATVFFKDKTATEKARRIFKTGAAVFVLVLVIAVAINQTDVKPEANLDTLKAEKDKWVLEKTKLESDLQYANIKIDYLEKEVIRLTNLLTTTQYNGNVVPLTEETFDGTRYLRRWSAEETIK